MPLTTRTIGALSCQIYDELPTNQSPEVIAVISHGFGAPGDNLVPLGPEILNRNPALKNRVRFVFPAAPLSSLEIGIPDGRGWWMLDIEKLNAAILSGQIRDQRSKTPEGFLEASQKLSELIVELQKESGLPLSQFVLGGFSQGSIVSTEVALNLPEPPAALVIWSGTLLCEQRWISLAEKSKKFPVLQSHGTQDPILPYEGGIWLKEMFEQHQFEVDFSDFIGPHMIPKIALEKFADLLTDLKV
ncbi:alpha/beta hydrolase [Gimesia aquarii]|uniref:Phospholipase/Carboxylesterase n=1 Tax=Gimesia aquarii TaxID=2527964 RepID=A0A517WZJ7_9PLAN|nr:phospholipase [Gimesia aquarii]QDU10681.1 Phospholipase/Carboxylesterase [Gimesia aquarii]